MFHSNNCVKYTVVKLMESLFLLENQITVWLLRHFSFFFLKKHENTLFEVPKL